ncbi:hypothetical protein LTEGF4_12740 [Limnohabitans sp. TEGF004]|nr:hypothetical protein LTEGF4_12740 [Limnohabitans sp. TEGF004]
MVAGHGCGAGDDHIHTLVINQCQLGLDGVRGIGHTVEQIHQCGFDRHSFVTRRVSLNIRREVEGVEPRFDRACVGLVSQTVIRDEGVTAVNLNLHAKADNQAGR